LGYDPVIEPLMGIRPNTQNHWQGWSNSYTTKEVTTH